jgi:DNA-binding PadR family transcriptional regulator
MGPGRGKDGFFFDMDFDYDFSKWGGPKRGRHGRKRMFGGGELRLVLLKLIADEPRHGYELIKAIEELTGGSYSPSPGTVYPTLSLLSDEGAIVECIEEGEGDTSRKAFSASDSGLAELEERAEEVERLMARLSGIGERQRRERSPELGRAAVNLGRVLANKFGQGRLDSETIEEIVDIIDEAAKKIERL